MGVPKSRVGPFVLLRLLLASKWGCEHPDLYKLGCTLGGGQRFELRFQAVNLPRQFFIGGG